ncbi:MAG TPA: MBL fold metallo-hydrolase [Hyphomicrobiaceae bacterium]|jgi:ribonuclease BN (tRNA processing enzyme)|nr:MBL fold metallo-hydrolase [Hyphomicrobiaceae bacterium]
MKLTIVGCGDAFGSGGRLQTCYHVEAAGTRFLIDCGATALIGFNRLDLDPNSIETIFISHLHGDHYAGLVWWLMHAQHVAKRRVPLTIIGPEGVAARYEAATEALFPGSSKVRRAYDLRFRELVAAAPLDAGPVRVTPFEVVHPSGAPSYALRFETEGKVLAFSGDTEWTDNLVTAGRAADLFMIECYQYEATTRYHLRWPTIADNIDRIAARRIMLTHMGSAMLARQKDICDPRIVFAEDGLTIDI